MGDLKSRNDRTVERQNGGMTHDDGMMERRKNPKRRNRGTSYGGKFPEILKMGDSQKGGKSTKILNTRNDGKSPRILKEGTLIINNDAKNRKTKMLPVYVRSVKDLISQKLLKSKALFSSNIAHRYPLL